ncbi:MAG TPA: hypothetical protein HPP80_03160 [Rhodospirillaceae bacterium]|nr:hypothetical protein [Rhodospirillaceae bacterium]
MTNIVIPGKSLLVFSAQDAIRSYGAGTLTTPAVIVDSAANVAAFLDNLQVLATAGLLSTIGLSDFGTPTLSITAEQANNDAAVLAEISGSYALNVSGVTAATASTVAAMANVTAIELSDSALNVGSSLDLLQSLAASGLLTSVLLTDGGTPTLLLSQTQWSNDQTALSLIAGSYQLTVAFVGAANATVVAASQNVAFVAVFDTAQTVSANLDLLQTIAAQGKLSGITLSDAGTPVLAVSASQLIADASALFTISVPYTLSVPGVAASLATFVMQQDASGRGVNGVALEEPGLVADGRNHVVGFQSASFTSGTNVVVLDHARTSYAIKIDAQGVTTLQDIGVGDSNYGKSVTVSGESILLFNAAHLSLSDPLTVAAMTTPPGGSAAVLNYPNDLYFVLNPANAQLAQLYSSVFSWEPQPSLSDFENWMNQLAGGKSITTIAQSFMSNSYFQQTIGDPGTTSAQHLAFVQSLYSHILGINLGTTNAGVVYWAEQMDDGILSAPAALLSFINAEASKSGLNAYSGATAGGGSGWLINPALTGGYADPGLQMDAQSVLSAGAAANFYNLSLIDPSTVPAAGITQGPINLSAGMIQISSGLTAGMVVLSPNFPNASLAASGLTLRDGPGVDSITINGSQTLLFLGNATTDKLHLSSGLVTSIVGFSPGKGSVLDVSGTVNESSVLLLDGTATPVHGAALNFGTAGSSVAYFVNIGSIGDGSAAAVATAANAAYLVADSAGNANTGALAEHVMFIGASSSGETEIWAFRTSSLTSVSVNGHAVLVPINAADSSGHVTAGEIWLVATLLGVSPQALGVADLA